MKMITKLLKGSECCLLRKPYILMILQFHAYSQFRLSYYPHRLDSFTGLLKEAFGQDVKHQVFGDFKPLGEISEPAFYIHVVEKCA
jgi:hypothetical protein